MAGATSITTDNQVQVLLPGEIRARETRIVENDPSKSIEDRLMSALDRARRQMAQESGEARPPMAYHTIASEDFAVQIRLWGLLSIEQKTDLAREISEPLKESLRVAYEDMESGIPNWLNTNEGPLNDQGVAEILKMADDFSAPENQEYIIGQILFDAPQDALNGWMLERLGFRPYLLSNGTPVGTCSYIGRRRDMEDAHLVTEFPISIGNTNHPVQLFGVFDGHGGASIAQYLKDNLVAELTEQLEKFNLTQLSNEGIFNALKLTFVNLNDAIIGNFKQLKKGQGSTACISILLAGKLWTANVGDSRAILVTPDHTIPLTDDAKPNTPYYDPLIKKRGGGPYYYQGQWRLGQINMARALGNRLPAGLSSRPKISCVNLTELPNKTQLVIVCDGLPEVSKTLDLASAVRNNAEDPYLAMHLVLSAFHAGSTDNLTAVVATLKPAEDPTLEQAAINALDDLETYLDAQSGVQSPA